MSGKDVKPRVDPVLNGMSLFLSYDASFAVERNAISNVLRGMGAQVQVVSSGACSGWDLKHCTHLVYKDGDPALYWKAHDAGIPCLEADWAKKSIEALSKMPVSAFTIHDDDAPWSRARLPVKDPALMLSPELLTLVFKQSEHETSIIGSVYFQPALGVLPELACLSRGWATAVSEFVNDGAAGAGVAPPELRRIKGVARELDLSFLKADFQENAHVLLGHFDMSEYYTEDEIEASGHSQMGRVLQAMGIAFMKQFGADTVDEAVSELFDTVARAYKKFLVVKTVEVKSKSKAKTKDKAAAPNVDMWGEKCMVSKIIDVLWHTHLMRPQHYLDSCSKLLGTIGVIDHDPGYISPADVPGSDFANKIELLYKRERQFSFFNSRYSSGTVCPFEKEDFLVEERETEEWLDEAFNEDMYHDDMECG